MSEDNFEVAPEVEPEVEPVAPKRGRPAKAKAVAPVVAPVAPVVAVEPEAADATALAPEGTREYTVRDKLQCEINGRRFNCKAGDTVDLTEHEFDVLSNAKYV